MTRQFRGRFLRLASGRVLAVVLSAAPVVSQPSPQLLSNMGQQITPLAPQNSRFEPLNPGLSDNPAWLASHAATTAVSPDGATLLVLTSGYNRFYDSTPTAPFPWDARNSTEYVFVYDIRTPRPIKKQVLQIPNAYHGIVFDPTGRAFYVAGGGDDNLHLFSVNAAGTWAEAAGSPIALNHVNPKLGNKQGVGLDIIPNGALAVNSSVGVVPCAAGVAISKDGQLLVVANYYNDSITVLSGGLGKWAISVPNFDLRPGKNDASKAGIPGGEYPFWVALKGIGTATAPYTAYVSSIRDREIVVVNLSGAASVVTRIPVKGQPNKMVLNAAQTLLYVADDQADAVDVIETSTNTVVETIPVMASMVPSTLARLKGANPNSVALSPDQTQLFVTNGNLNCVAVIALGGTNTGDHVIGLIPTGWYPNSVSVVSYADPLKADLKVNYAYVVNGKSPTGPNPGFCYGGYGPVGAPNCNLSNQYNPQLTKAGLQVFPLPGPAQLETLTAQVAVNNRLSQVESDSDAAVMAAVRQAVQHVVFIIKENRTYDQILGDLEIGNGDPDLTLFGEAITPNQHNLARKFVTLDNFLDTAEVSYDGWLWTTSGQAPDVVEHQYPTTYAYRGLSLDSEGVSRNVNVSIKNLADRIKANPFTSSDPDILPGQTNVAAPDGPNNEVNSGYLWDAALRAGLSVRNYGFFIDTTLYSTKDFNIPVLRNPASTGTVVAIPSSASLAPYTDPYFRGFDNTLPDYYRYTEWAREFDQLPARRQGGVVLRKPVPFPALSLVRFMHDHTGNWTSPPLDGVDTPELQVADNDYAVGLLVQKISHSEHANNTLIFIIEDDAQDGGDHVDSHRSIAFVVGACVKQGALISTAYNTIDFLRTIEEVLGLPPLNLNDALARPMADVFNFNAETGTVNLLPWGFTAKPSPLLYTTGLPLPPKPAGLVVPRSTHDVKYWAHATRGMDFSDEDRVDPEGFNRILWQGIMDGKPYPATPSGVDLRQNRAELLARHKLSRGQKSAPAPKAAAN